ncbi:MAG: phenylalanine--tRNA ligase subunit alpha [Planctomycetes bacterium]|nr:phenylalanine--tRNA ligase subunit alpha [Planctomycetota bacterium]
MELPQTQFNVLTHLAGRDGPVRMPDLAAALHCDQSPVVAACAMLAELGFVLAEESGYDELRLGPAALEHLDGPLPERVIIGVLAAQGGECPLTDVPNHCDLVASQVGQSLRWLNQRGWARKDGGTLKLSDAGRAALDQTQPDEHLIRALANDRVARAAELAAEGIPVAEALELLVKRKGFLTIKQRTDRFASITAAGRKVLAEGAKGRQAVTQLTPELLADGGWRNVDIQPYDVTLAAKKLYPGKEHAFQRTLDRVRRVFLEMGFEEIISPWVESCFWNFDCLFQPQDHPARDMQDTFYVGRPGHTELPDSAFVERICATHENGGDTGSSGWQYRWSRELAHKPVLRTHTTAATIRALWRHKQGRSGKYFIIGPVFRRETVDYKHLPIFHQVDGIIVDPQANLATLKGTLAAFYRKMGFDDVRFLPSFFPYTEPSAEVMVYLKSREEWVEMGGSGIFRPEVTLPVGITDRVLAWGLGLERVAMMTHELDSIGELYFAAMPWLREEPLCRS